MFDHDDLTEVFSDYPARFEEQKEARCNPELLGRLIECSAGHKRRSARVAIKTAYKGKQIGPGWPVRS